MYDPKGKFISYVGHAHLPCVAKIRDIIPILNKKAGFPPNTPLDLYEVIIKRSFNSYYQLLIMFLAF